MGAVLAVVALPFVAKALVDVFSKRPSRLPPHVEKAVQATPPVEKAVQATPPVVKEKAMPPLDATAPHVEPPHHVAKAVHTTKTSASQIIQEARLQMGVDCCNHYNFGVCGQTGVGKSSFINGFLGLEGDDSCSIGEVETTQQIKRYSTKKAPYLMVWDMPGAGTHKHPAHTYFEDKKLFVYDAILILSSERFLEVDFEILRSARKYETPCVFVRTKCDIGVQSRALRDRVNAFEASKRFREDVRSNFLAQLSSDGLQGSFSTPKLFFISNRFFSDDGAYSLYDRRTRTWDTSLSSMDEQLLTSFIYDVAKKRALYPPK